MSRVLIIDDDPIALEIMRDALSLCGFCEFDFAENGRTASQLFKENPDSYSLITTDLLMPDFDGIEFVSFLATFPNPCPIVVSSSAAPALIRSALVLADILGLTVLGKLDKPISVEELRVMVADVSIKSEMLEPAQNRVA